MAGREALVVAGAATVSGDPGTGCARRPSCGAAAPRRRARRACGRSPAGSSSWRPRWRACRRIPHQPRPAGRGCSSGTGFTAGAVGVAVLDRGGDDHHGQHQAGGVDGDVPLAAAVLLGVIPAPAGPGHGVRGPHRLGVDHGRGRAGSRPAAARAWSRHPSCSSCRCRRRASARSSRRRCARAGSRWAGTARAPGPVDVHDRVHDHPAGVHHWPAPPQSLRPGTSSAHRSSAGPRCRPRERPARAGRWPVRDAPHTL